MRRTALLFLGVAFVAFGCAVAPRGPDVTGDHLQSMTASETSPGRTAFESRHGGQIDHPIATLANRLLLELGSRGGMRGKSLSIAVLRTEEPNAFVLASGHIYLTEGMVELVCTEDDLAAVLAHEMGHLDDLAAFSRPTGADADRLKIEADADDQAAAMLLDAGFEPSALAIMIERLRDEQPEGWADFRCDRLSRHLGPADDFSTP